MSPVQILREPTYWLIALGLMIGALYLFVMMCFNYISALEICGWDEERQSGGAILSVRLRRISCLEQTL